MTQLPPLNISDRPTVRRPGLKAPTAMQNVTLVHESLLKLSSWPPAAGNATTPARASRGTGLAVAAVAGSANNAVAIVEPTNVRKRNRGNFCSLAVSPSRWG